MASNFDASILIQMRDQASKQASELKVQLEGVSTALCGIKTAATSANEGEQKLKKGFMDVTNNAARQTHGLRVLSHNMIALSIPAALVTRNIVKHSVDISQALFTVQAAIHAIDKQMNAYRIGLQKVSKKTMFSIVDIAKGNAELGRSGFSLNEQLKLTLPIAKTAALSNRTYAETTFDAIKMVKSFGGGMKEFAPLMNKAAQETMLTNVSFAELIQGMGKAAPAWKQMGGDASQLIAVLGQLSQAGLSPSLTGRQIASATGKLDVVDPKLRAFLSSIGSPIKQSDNLVKVLLKIDSAAKKQGLTMRELGGLYRMLFGGDVKNTLQPIIDHTIDINKNTKELTGNIDYLGQVSNRMSKKLFYSAKDVASSWVTLEASLVDPSMTDELTRFFKELTSISDSLADSSPLTKHIIDWGVLITAGAFPILQAATSFAILSAVLKGMIGVNLLGWLKPILGVVGDTAGLLLSWPVAILSVGYALDKGRNKLAKWGDELKDTQPLLSDILYLLSAIGKAINSLHFGDSIKSSMAFLGNVSDYVGEAFSPSNLRAAGMEVSGLFSPANQNSTISSGMGVSGVFSPAKQNSTININIKDPTKVVRGVDIEKKASNHHFSLGGAMLIPGL